MEGVGWIGAIIIGGLAGWIAEKVMGGDHSILTNIGIGIVGALVLNALMIMLMAALVQGVHLRNGFWSALIGSILLGIFNAILTAIIF